MSPEILPIIFGTQLGELNPSHSQVTQCINPPLIQLHSWFQIILYNASKRGLIILSVFLCFAALISVQQSPSCIVAISRLLLFSQLAMHFMFLWMESFLVDIKLHYFQSFTDYLNHLMIKLNIWCHINYVFYKVLLLGQGRIGDLHLTRKSTYVLDRIRLVFWAWLLDCQLVLSSRFFLIKCIVEKSWHIIK